jgi:hypothetical protein
MRCGAIRAFTVVALALLASCGHKGPCTPEGELIAVKEPDPRCCGGAQWIQNVSPTDDGGACTWGSPVDIQICVRCGDHICGPGENVCNCPSDCSVDAGARTSVNGQTGLQPELAR